MQSGDRVRIAHHEFSFYKRLHSYNQLAWSSRMATYIDKIGIVKDLMTQSVQVTIYSWRTFDGTTKTITSSNSGDPARKDQLEMGRNAVVEATYSWHPKAVLLAQNVCMLDGDRAILIRNKDLSKAAMVSIRILDDETFLLRLPHAAESLIWKQSENMNDVILPIYSGRNLSTIMHDRNLPTRLANIDRTPERVVFGTVSLKANATDIMEALHYWSETGDEKQFHLLLHYHPELKNATINGQTLLMLAVELGLWSAVSLLLSINAEKNITDPEGETPLHCSILNGHLPCVDRILNVPTINPNIQDNDGNTPLHVLAIMENVPNRGAMLSRLLSNFKVDQMIMNNNGLTALQLAIIADQNEVVKSMIRMKPTSDGRYSLSPLHLAASYGHIRVLKTILKYSSDVRKITKSRRTALHFAVERWNGNADKDMQRLCCIQLLVSLGVPLNKRDCDGITALHLAAQATQGQTAISNDKVQVVLQMKKSNMHLEKLALALRPHWPVAVMCFLITQGANPYIRDRSGYVPLELVNEPTLKSLFEQYIACRPRSCVPMSYRRAGSFDTSNVTMCTFNCNDNVADVVFIPCGHRVICATCASSTLLKRCPLCYQQIIVARNSYGEKVELGEKIIQHEEFDSDNELSENVNMIDEAQTEKTAQESVERTKKAIEANGEKVEIDDKIIQHEEFDDDNELSENVKMIDEAQIEKIEQEAVERVKKAVEAEKNEIVRELRDKLEQLELEVTCAICMDQRCSAVFQCGHTACADCSNPSKLKLCHICRQTIKRRTTIYT